MTFYQLLTLLCGGTLAGSVAAGSLNAPAAPGDPGSAMYTLQDLTNRLATGAAGQLRTGPFVEPTAGPGSTVTTLNDLMAQMPAVSADALTPAEVASGKTFWGLSAGAWGPQSGTAELAACSRAPGAGHSCYLPLAPSGAIVTDLVTGLDWQRCSVGQTWNAGTQTCDGTALTSTWDQAMANWPATAEWRLPTIGELRTLVYCSGGAPVLIDMTLDSTDCSGSYQIPTIVSWAFPQTPASFFWSSSPLAGHPSYASDVHFFNGNVDSDSKGNPICVRLVRGGQ